MNNAWKWPSVAKYGKKVLTDGNHYRLYEIDECDNFVLEILLMGKDRVYECTIGRLIEHLLHPFDQHLLDSLYFLNIPKEDISHEIICVYESLPFTDPAWYPNRARGWRVVS